MLPHDGEVAKRATKTARFHKTRTVKSKLVRDKEMYEHSERLTPTAQRIFEYIKSEAALGIYCCGQAATASKLGISMPTCQKAFAQLQEKRFIARKSHNVYMLNPERFYQGVEEMLVVSKREFAELVQVYRERMVKRQALPTWSRKAKHKPSEDIDLGF